MKIRSLLEAEFETAIKQYKSKNTFKYVRDRERKYERGGDDIDFDKEGAFGKVYPKPVDHTLTKIPHEAAKKNEDAYLRYIKYIIKNKLAQSNPYFPRIYELKEWKDKNGFIKYKIEIERLLQIEKFDEQVIQGLCYNNFKENDVDGAYQKVNQWDPKKDEQIKWSIVLAILVEEVINGATKPKDNLLKDACNIIYKLSKKGLFLDIHYGNIMVRRSPHPQLVIVDPLFNKASDIIMVS